MSTTSSTSKFERHSHGEGLKGHVHPLLPRLRPRPRPQVPGRGHRRAGHPGPHRRRLARSAARVFLYYYFDVGNTQAAHGRAPAVALGHKLANPEAIVISYQGDGDLASIGLAEIVSTAQLGIPITVIFINNAIYGMTGGQMAPTTLMGQTDRHQPRRAATAFNGQPMKMAELIAGLDGPVYVERVALFDAKQRKKAKKAIKKAVQLQVEGRGYSFVEVLAECPTHLKMTPEETEKWVKEKMAPGLPARREEGRHPSSPGSTSPNRPTFEPATRPQGDRRRRPRSPAALLHGLPRPPRPRTTSR